MKKTIATLLAACSVTLASAVEYSTTSYSYTYNLGSNYDSAVDGFSFTLNSGLMLSNGSSPTATTLTGDYKLTSLVTISAKNTGLLGTEYGLIVLGADNEIIGKSTATINPTGSQERVTLTFTGVGQKADLIIDAETTYSFLAVSSNVLSAAATNDGNVYTYSVTDGDVTLSVKNLTTDVSTTQTIEDGAVAPALRCNYNTSSTYTGNFVIGGSQTTLLPMLRDISVTQVVPEPATATLSLLALAGLAARRRRK